MAEGTRDAAITEEIFGIGEQAMAFPSMGRRKRKGNKRRHKSSRRKSHSSRKSRKKNAGSTSSRRKHSSKRGIKYTKNGQPYKIMPNGRARFLPKR